MSPRPHDLLRLPRTEWLPSDAPAWARRALSAAPWVVVRRAVAPMGQISVGVRGRTRAQRYATYVDAGVVCQVRTPEDLAHTVPVSGRELAVMRTLRTARSLLDTTGWAWGPTGSVGFELATRVPVATTESDLDLLIRVPRTSTESGLILAAVHRELSALAVRVDCQVETSAGAAALAELVSGESDVLVRTAAGPRLVPRAVAVS